jgi:Protein of unknown function (DUF4242)
MSTAFRGCCDSAAVLRWSDTIEGGAVPRYLVERYLPGMTEQELTEATVRVRGAAAELAAHGDAIRYLGSVFIPAEESCFCEFEAASPETVARANELGRFRFARITEGRRLPREKEGTCELSH